MVVLVAARADRSPAMRCEKNSMGRCRTFHMNDELDTTAILPSRRSRYMAFSTSTTMRTAPTAISKAMKGYSHSGFFPPSSRSMNTWESAGLMMPTTAVTAAVMATNASAAREPCRRGPTNSHTDRGLPLGWKSGTRHEAQHDAREGGIELLLRHGHLAACRIVQMHLASLETAAHHEVAEVPVDDAREHALRAQRLGLHTETRGLESVGTSRAHHVGSLGSVA